MASYTHKSGEVIVTVAGSALHKQMVAKAADTASGWTLTDPAAEPPRDVRRGHGTAAVSLDASPRKDDD